MTFFNKKFNLVNMKLQSQCPPAGAAPGPGAGTGSGPGAAAAGAAGPGPAVTADAANAVADSPITEL
jgi:hypothetical protein